MLNSSLPLVFKNHPLATFISNLIIERVLNTPTPKKIKSNEEIFPELSDNNKLTGTQTIENVSKATLRNICSLLIFQLGMQGSVSLT